MLTGIFRKTKLEIIGPQYNSSGESPAWHNLGYIFVMWIMYYIFNFWSESKNEKKEQEVEIAKIMLHNLLQKTH
jgi:hypothetical protein